MLRRRKTPSHMQREGEEEGMRIEWEGRNILHVLQYIACVYSKSVSVWVRGYLHGMPESCNGQHGLRSNRTPCANQKGSSLVWKGAFPKAKVLIKSSVCIALWAGQGRRHAYQLPTDRERVYHSRGF